MELVRLKTMGQISTVTKKLVFLSFIACLLSACASNAQYDSSADDTKTKPEANVDRLEPFNRKVFAFNDTLDRFILKPVAKGYDWALPGPVKNGVGNFFDNLGEVGNIINDGLQWKWQQAAHDSGRLLINSTVGLLGIFDVASKAGLEKSDGENFSQTLAKWGVPRGSYLVLPFLGSTTVRGGLSLPADWVTSPVYHLESTNAQIGATVVDTVHTRAELLEVEELASGDRYLFIREAYLQRQDYLENDGKLEDDFGDDFGDEYEDDY